MQITFTSETVDHFLPLAAKDKDLAKALAQQLLDAVDPVALGNYLLENGVAFVVARLSKAPEETLRELLRLSSGDAKAAPARRRGRPKTQAVASGKKPARGRLKRQRLGVEQAEKIKAGVRAFLGKHGAASRKAINAAVSFPSTALYNRIMGELKDTGEVVQKGEKSKTVYSLKGKVSTAKKGKPAKKAEAVKGTAKKTKVVKAKGVKKRAPRLCPVPGQGRAGVRHDVQGAQGPAESRAEEVVCRETRGGPTGVARAERPCVPRR